MKLNLENFPLMGDKGAQRLIQVFADQGVLARFVGGCVRDAVLGKAAHDIDMAVPMPPDKVMDLLTKKGIKSIPTGYDFGTVTAVMEGQAFQITSLRVDWETDGRHARVVYGTNWEADALRRDFTINALYAERDGTVLDYVEGLTDLKSGVIRFVGEAHQRIREDYLRILRYFRFLAWYGHGPVNPEAMQACADLCQGLGGLSRERIGHEFLKLLAAPVPLPSLSLMDKTGLTSFILPHPLNFKALEGLLLFEKAPNVLCRLAALSWPQLDSEGLAKALRLSRAQKQYLEDCHDRLDDYPSSEKTIYRNLYHDGVRLFEDLTMLSLALRPLSSTPSLLGEAFKISAGWQRPSFPIKGKDLVEIGLKPGLKLGSLLKRCEEWWIDQNFQPDQEACLRWVRDRKS
jgi:tRNA nucleotidyltransferase/poly(A) polymerase